MELWHKQYTCIAHPDSKAMEEGWWSYGVFNLYFEKLSYSLLNLICCVCSMKGTTNFHFAVQPSVGQMNVGGNHSLFPTCLPVLCLSAVCVGGHLITA